MENLKVFACSDSAEKFTEDICNYLKINKNIDTAASRVLPYKCGECFLQTKYERKLQ